MTELSRSSSLQSSNLRRQPKQQRGKARVEKILDAAAAVFDEVGYEAATTHLIAAKAGTAIGSLYQFFPDKAAIFKAMEVRHAERVKLLYDGVEASGMVHLPLRQMIHTLVMAVANLFEHPISRVLFVQFYTARQIFQSIDESMTQEAIDFMASLLSQRNPALSEAQCNLLAEVCVHSSNAVILAALRSPDLQHRQQLTEQIKDLLVSYLEPHVGDNRLHHVMKVMMCPHCRSPQLSKNGYRRGKQCYRCKECGRQFVESVSMDDSAQTIQLLAISGSLRQASSNTALLQAAIVLAPHAIEIKLYEGLGSLPHFNPDLEPAEPSSVTDLRLQIREADGLLISSPEYAHGVPGVLKNALDWLVGGSEFVGKPIALLHASPRATYALASLTEIVTVMSGRLVSEASITLPLLGRHLDASGIVADPELSLPLQTAIATFANAIASPFPKENRSASSQN